MVEWMVWVQGWPFDLYIFDIDFYHWHVRGKGFRAVWTRNWMKRGSFVRILFHVGTQTFSTPIYFGSTYFMF